MPQPAEPTFVWASDALWRRTGREVVILPAGAVDPMCLQGTAAVLWDVLDDPRSIAEIAGELAGTFMTDPVVVARDIGPVLQELVERGAVRECRT